MKIRVVDKITLALSLMAWAVVLLPLMLVPFIIMGSKAAPESIKMWKEGQCIRWVDPQAEPWDKPGTVNKILKVGKRKYLYTMWINGEWRAYTSDEFEFFTDYTEVKCPDAP